MKKTYSETSPTFIDLQGKISTHIYIYTLYLLYIKSPICNVNTMNNFMLLFSLTRPVL